MVHSKQNRKKLRIEITGELEILIEQILLRTHRNMCVDVLHQDGNGQRLINNIWRVTYTL